MKNLQEATERICELKGNLIALDALLPAMVEALPASVHDRLMQSFDAHAEAARTVMLHADISDLVLATFEQDVARNRAVLARGVRTARSATALGAVDDLLLTATPIATFAGSRALTNASGFFFRRDDRLFLVTNRHVLSDAPSSHFPDRIEIGLHVDAQDLTRYRVLSLPLYRDGLGLWRDGADSGGPVDVAAIELPAARLPGDAVLRAFDETHLGSHDEEVSIGDALAIVGFPLGFHDTIHHLAVARNASIASAFGVRFQQQGCFLTDARTHRGSSGAPVVRRRSGGGRGASSMPWQLIGVHSTRMDMRTRDRRQDESLGLNCAWYADILPTLTGTP
ncbi:MAG: trypsin-like peptidase domain-containing protein [Burkholderiaceae bacterium]